MGRVKSFSQLNPKLQSAICFISTFMLGFVLFKCIFFIGYVPTSSMEPTLETGSVCLGIRTINPSKCEVGDIVVFEHDGERLVKRVAAVGGEEISTDLGSSFSVPESHFFMLGDNAGDSYDSRYWEDPYVSEDDIIAKIILP